LGFVRGWALFRHVFTVGTYPKIPAIYLMKTHPDLDRKATVEQMIAEATQKIAAKK